MPEVMGEEGGVVPEEKGKEAVAPEENGEEGVVALEEMGRRVLQHPRP